MRIDIENFGTTLLSTSDPKHQSTTYSVPGELISGAGGLEENLLRQFTGLRAELFSIGDLTSGRMPLAYVQLVQVRWPYSRNNYFLERGLRGFSVAFVPDCGVTHLKFKC